MKTPAQQLGQCAEDHACKHLMQRGLRLIMRNHRCRWGELDLIMMHDNTLVIIEVKSRKTADTFTLYPPITPSKQQRMQRATQDLLTQHTISYAALRFDVVMLVGLEVYRWYIDAFRADM